MSKQAPKQKKSAEKQLNSKMVDLINATAELLENQIKAMHIRNTAIAK